MTVNSTGARSATQRIEARINELGDWRGATLSKIRHLIKQADPHVVEEWKWQKATNPGVPVWSHDGIICTGETYKSIVKLTFAKGAQLADPERLFNSSLDGKVDGSLVEPCSLTPTRPYAHPVPGNPVNPFARAGGRSDRARRRLPSRC